MDPFADVDVVNRMADDDPALIDRALTAVEKTEYRRMSYAVSDEARENATRMIEKVPGVARMAMATGSPGT